MKRIILSLLCAASVLPMAAGSRYSMDLLSKARLRDARLSTAKTASVAHARKCAPSVPGTVRALVALADGYSASDLEAEEVDVDIVRGGIALCVIDINDVERVAELDCVRRLSLDTPRSLMVKNAREASKVDLIHQGVDLPQAYTGKNVICGIYDQGVDPNHINFNDADGNTRIFSLTYMRANSLGRPQSSNYDKTNLHMFKTDDASTYHGTHTLGIMAGSYRGAFDASHSGLEAGAHNPYYGMAPDADIMVTCGETSDYFIANGVDMIVERQYVENKPAVINLSLGGNIGAHDGKSLMSQYLEYAGDDAIIVVAAGNDGNVPLHAEKAFSEGDTEFKSLIKAYYEPELNDNLRYGQVAIYGADTSLFDVQAVVLNRKTGKIALRIPLASPGSGTATYHISSIDYSMSDDDIVSQPLSKYFNGYLGIGSSIDEDSEKFYCMLDYFLTNNQDKNADDSFVPGFIINAKPGQTARMWCDGVWTCLDSYGIDGWSDGTTDGTISDLATAPNVVVVGSYNTEGTIHNIDGSSEPFEPSLGEFRPGEVTSFSAYGTLEDGRALPHVCAPGVSLISSTSRFYVDEPGNDVDKTKLSAMADFNGVSHWWSQTGGTSMAAPVVSGAIALWLQVYPYLSVEEVLDIIRATAVVDSDVESCPEPRRWGAGKFDAYAGLKEVIRRSGVNSVQGEGSGLLITPGADRSYMVSLPGVQRLDLEVYAADGKLVKAVSASGDDCMLDLSSFGRGAYIVKANSLASARIMVK